MQTPPVSFALANGTRVQIIPGVGAGLVAFRARLDLGPPSSPASIALAALLAERLARPATGEPATQAGLAFTLHDDPAAFSNFRWIEAAAHALPDDVPTLLAVLARRLDEAARPLDAGAWTGIVKKAQERESENAESSETALWAAALAALYPAGSPGSVPAWGPAGALATLTPERLVDYGRAYAQPALLHVVLAGAIDEAAARAALEEALGRRITGPVNSSRDPFAAPRGPAQWTVRTIVRPGKAQNDILVVWPGERATATDRAATQAILYLLGETGYAGRLGHALVDPGLAYSVYTTLEEAPGAPGFLAVQTAASQKDTPEVLRRIREILETTARAGFTQAQMDEAKTYLRGRDLLRREGSEDAAARSMEETAAPLGFDPQALTLDQLNATARRLAARGAPAAFVLGPPLVPPAGRAYNRVP